MKGRVKRLGIRLTEAEFKELQEKSAGFSSVSSMLRVAVKQLNNNSFARRDALTTELLELYKRHDRNLSLMGSNLNQAVKAINEFAKVGLLTDSLVKDLLPTRLTIIATTLATLQQELRNLGRAATQPLAK